MRTPREHRRARARRGPFAPALVLVAASCGQAGPEDRPQAHAGETPEAPADSTAPTDSTNRTDPTDSSHATVPTDPAAGPAPSEAGPRSPGLELDRHALHGAAEAKGTSLHELRSAMSVLQVLGERAPAPYRELFAELGAVGSDEAAALALAWDADVKVQFAGRGEAFAELFRALLASGGVVQHRAALQAALDARPGGDSR